MEQIAGFKGNMEDFKKFIDSMPNVEEETCDSKSIVDEMAEMIGEMQVLDIMASKAQQEAVKARNEYAEKLSHSLEVKQNVAKVKTHLQALAKQYAEAIEKEKALI